MSSYIDVVHPDRHAPYLDIPNDVVEYLHYLDFVKMRSPRTINAYYLDLRGFFRFMMGKPTCISTSPSSSHNSSGSSRSMASTAS